MKISIITPSDAPLRSGNQHTATRWANFLRESGHDVTVARSWDGAPVDVLIALHARKSSVVIRKFHRAHPDLPLILVLTGTDLYRDIETHASARTSLELASRLVVLQPAGIKQLPKRWRAKTRVIIQSSDTELTHEPPKNRFQIVVVGHLRKEKDPFRAVMALAHLPQQPRIHLAQLGGALNPEMEREAKQWMKSEPRYHWLGSRSHPETLRRLAASHLMVISSIMEGGANVICEAGRIGVPILASRMSGNIGMLGTSYPGYFPLFNEQALARLIKRSMDDANFYRSLKRAVDARRPLFAPRAERRGLRDLLVECT